MRILVLLMATSSLAYADMENLEGVVTKGGVSVACNFSLIFSDMKVKLKKCQVKCGRPKRTLRIRNYTISSKTLTFVLDMVVFKSGKGRLTNATIQPLLLPLPASGHMIVVGPFGGNGGEPFTDEPYWEQNGKAITAVRVRSGEIIDSIQFKYGEEWAPMHGGNGMIGRGLNETLHLTTTQKISLVQGSYGRTFYDPYSPLVMSLLMIIDDGTVFCQFGHPIGDAVNYSSRPFISYPNPCSLAYVSGRAGTVLNTSNINGTYLVSLTLHWQC